MWARIEREWPRFKVDVKVRWNKLTEQQLDAIAGRRGLLVRRIADAYDVSPLDAEQQLVLWQDGLAQGAAKPGGVQ